MNLDGREIVKHYESLHDGDLKKIGLQPKLCPAGIWTQGYGRAMRKKNGSFMTSKNTTKAQAEAAADPANAQQPAQQPGILQRMLGRG